MATLITSGIDYARFFDDLRAVIRQEVTEALSAETSSAPLVGGIELAQEVTRLSKARIYQLVSERAICHSKRGNRLTFNRADLLQWLADGKREATAE